MSAITFRIIDASSFDVLADVTDEGAIESFLLANQRYETSRIPLKGVTVVETNAIDMNLPG